MKHHALAAVTGLLIAAALVPTSSTQAASADPTGYWRKADQGERPGKMQLFRCGSGNRLLCAKIVWLENPLDSKGRPLHDIRNENPSLRDRPILGLPIINGLQPVAANQWKGSIYNPEDGNTYSATLTLVSRNQINLRGCKGWILCGERIWVRTTLPKPEPEPQIEASAEPEATTQPASAIAAAEPEAPPVPEDPLANTEMLTPAVDHDAEAGYRFLNASTSAEPPAGLSGESVPSMFVMTKPIAGDEPEAAPSTNTAAVEPPAQAAPAPAAEAPKPKPRTMQASAAPAPRPQPTQVAPATTAAAVPADPEAEAIDTAETENAETASIEEPAMSRRQRRLLRRQQQQEGQGLLPWLR
jgi:uncharacterized protein (DUF2147 family)